jgi:hypothetical protein
MNDNCLTGGEDYFSSPLLNERTQRFGRNFLYTVLVFAALCVVSYMINA